MMERRTKANAAFAEIRAILEDVPLGICRTEIGLNLRRTLSINGVLSDSEVWHGIKISDVDVLNVMDHQILRYICGAHAKHQLSFYILKLDPFLWLIIRNGKHFTRR